MGSGPDNQTLWALICDLIILLSISTSKIFFELVHEISDNVAFWHVYTRTSLCSLLLSLETQNGVQSVA